MSNEELLKQLLKSWRSGDKEKVVAIIEKNPHLIEMLDLVKKKERRSFLQVHKDLLVSLPFSILFSLVFVGLYWVLELRFGYGLSMFLLGLLLILVSTAISSLVSFEFRSLKLPVFISIGIMQFSNLLYILLDSQEAYSLVNEATPFWEYFLTNEVGRLIGTGFGLLFFGIFPVVASIYFTKLLIGLPEVDEPYKIAFDLPKIKIEEIQNIVAWILGTHFMFGKLKRKNLTNSWYGKFSTVGDMIDSSSKYITAVEIIEHENKLTLKLMLYGERSMFTKIVRTPICENIGYEIGASLMMKIKTAKESTDRNFEELHNFALGYTKNRFLEYIELIYDKVRVNKAYFFLATITLFAIVLILLYPESLLLITGIATIVGTMIVLANEIKKRNKRKQNRESITSF